MRNVIFLALILTTGAVANAAGFLLRAGPDRPNLVVEAEKAVTGHCSDKTADAPGLVGGVFTPDSLVTKSFLTKAFRENFPRIGQNAEFKTIDADGTLKVQMYKGDGSSGGRVKFDLCAVKVPIILENGKQATVDGLQLKLPVDNLENISAADRAQLAGLISTTSMIGRIVGRQGPVWILTIINVAGEPYIQDNARNPMANGTPVFKGTWNIVK